MEMSARESSRAWWIVVVWLVTMTSGSLAANLLRLPTGIAIDASLLFLAHGVIAVAMASAVIGHLVRAHATARFLPALFVTATFVCGFFTIRSFEPLTSTAHATLAAYAALALAATGTPGLGGILPIDGRRGRSWQAWVVGVGVLLLILQIALGALLRHHLIGYGWHLFVAGLAALAVLIPGVAISRDAGAAIVEKRAAWSAMISLLVQLLLGVVLFLMILAGSNNVSAWLLTTVAHVVTGTITLLTAARLAQILRTGR